MSTCKRCSRDAEHAVHFASLLPELSLGLYLLAGAVWLGGVTRYGLLFVAAVGLFSWHANYRRYRQLADTPPRG